MVNTVFTIFQTKYFLDFSSASRTEHWDLPNTVIFQSKDVASGGSVSQAVVFRYKEIGATIKIGKKVIFLSKYSLDRNNDIFSMFRTQYTPDFFIADHYGLRNTAAWMS
jgi:hypothetical protein